jgi:hypothetical protein
MPRKRLNFVEVRRTHDKATPVATLNYSLAGKRVIGLANQYAAYAAQFCRSPQDARQGDPSRNLNLPPFGEGE